MKKLIVLFLVTVLTVLVGSPRATLLKTETSTLGAGSADTITISGITITGDSLGVIIEFDKDSVSGELRYQYVSPNGQTDTTQFANLPTLLEVPATGYSAFSGKVPVTAGVYKLQYYLIVTNDKSSTQAVTSKVYSISHQ